MALFDNTAKIEFAVQHFITANEQQMKRMFAELITKAAKTAVMEKYAEIQTIVDEIILSPEMRIEIHKLIMERVREEVNQHIKDMFGKE